MQIFPNMLLLKGFCIRLNYLSLRSRLLVPVLLENNLVWELIVRTQILYFSSRQDENMYSYSHPIEGWIHLTKILNFPIALSKKLPCWFSLVFIVYTFALPLKLRLKCLYFPLRCCILVRWKHSTVLRLNKSISNELPIRGWARD